MMRPSIITLISKYRQQLTNAQLVVGALRYSILLIVLLLAVVTLEAIFYLDVYQRGQLVPYLIIFFFTGWGFLLLRKVIHNQQLFGNSTDAQLAQKVGGENKHIRDRLLNAMQLDEQIKSDPKGEDLAIAAIEKVREGLDALPKPPISKCIPPNLLKNAAMTAISFLFIIIGFWSTLGPAFTRLVQPNTEFPVPLPFTLKSLSPHVRVLGGDTAAVSIAGFGKLPDSISIYWEDQVGIHSQRIGLEQEVYQFIFPQVRQDVSWYAGVISTSFFSAWDEIRTISDTIFVTDRPILEQLDFTIIPPAYTSKTVVVHPGNITDISLLSGSRVNIQGTANKSLTSAWLQVDNHSTSLNVNGLEVSGSISVTESFNAAIYCQDENTVSNLNPTHYRFNVIPDMKPDVLVITPETEFELDESNQVNITLQTSDDYGFSSAWIQYRMVPPEYLGQGDTTQYERQMGELMQNVRSQQLSHFWDINNLHPAPEDELHFTIHIADNNTVSGPSVSISPKFIGRYPSIEDLFERMEEEEEKVETYSEEIEITLEDVQNLVEELQLEMLKSDEMTWEQQQKAEESIQEMQEIFQQIEDIQESVQKIQDQAEKNNLISDQLMGKFDKFQELLDNIMTPELMEAMDKMQQAMENMDMQQMMEALKDFDYDLEAFEEQLDRFIEMFEQAIAEQKMDEVVKRLERMTEEQTQIADELTQDPEVDMTQLASRERRQEEQFKSLENTMEAAQEAISELSPVAAEQMKTLQNSQLAKDTKSDLNDARKDMQRQDQSHAVESTQNAKQGLEQMLSEAKQIQQKFQQDTVDEMMNEFLAVVRNILYISQAQEKLVKSTEGLRSSSPLLVEKAAFQNRIKQEGTQLMAQMMELSKKTFYITPAISRALGKTTVAMDKAIGELEQKKTMNSRTQQKKAMEGLNETAYLLLLAMEEMEVSQSASGFESYMEQLSQMSQQQQGINKGTMSLGQLGMMAQQQMMQQLQAQQQALQQALQEMLGDMPGEQTGGLSKAEQDMESVIQDFKRRQVTRETMERQERILSRMLDSQKSLTQKDYSEKRRSHAGDVFEYSGPAGLPADKGQREMLLINAMESALQEGHSREYQQMMKHYFRSLQEDTEKMDE